MLRLGGVPWFFWPCRALPSRASSSGLISAFSLSMWNSSWFWVALLISVCFNLPSITFSWESFCDACRPWSAKKKNPTKQLYIRTFSFRLFCFSNLNETLFSQHCLFKASLSFVIRLKSIKALAVQMLPYWWPYSLSDPEESEPLTNYRNWSQQPHPPCLPPPEAPNNNTFKYITP